jgi:hypothetical protein
MSRRAVAASVICFAALALYAPTIHDYFLQDDFGVVSLFSRRTLGYFPRWFVSPWTEDIWGYVPDEIRPFPAASYVIASWFGATAPEPNHIINIALHAFNGVLVMWIAEAAAGLGVATAMAAGLIFVLLPIQAESVAWITGRVDSLPTLFYFASYLLFARWVRLKPDSAGSGSVRLQADHAARANYVWSVLLFFAALFSKQNTVTMVPALLMFDWIGRRRRIEITWAWLRPYVPYLVLTIGFLALRYVVFHEVARESLLSAQRVREFLSDCSRHLVRLVFGGPGVRQWSAQNTLIVAAAIVLVGTLGWRIARAAVQDLWRAAIYFGVVWVALGLLPILMSGYYSPRHVYLASLGWAITLGIGLEILRRAYPARVFRPVAITLAAALVIAYAVQLRGVVRDWNRNAAISHAAVEQVEREAEANPGGTLIIAGVPRSSWAFAIPYSVRPPFIRKNVGPRVYVISDSFDHCCAAPLWDQYTRDALRNWEADQRHPPVVALYWDARTGRMSHVSDRDDPQVHTLVSLLMDTHDRASLDSVIQGFLRDYVALRN